MTSCSPSSNVYTRGQSRALVACASSGHRAIPRASDITQFARRAEFLSEGVNLASFGACRAVVFGNYGEASRDVHTLIHVAAKRLATKHWRLLGARSQGEVHGFYVAQLRRRMGVTAVREFARHRLRRSWSR